MKHKTDDKKTEMKYIMSLSGGVASAVAAERAIKRYGRENVTLWFADTKWEDEDLYRFLDDLMKRWGGELITYTDGRTPLQVSIDAKIIPNSFAAPCTFKLKIKPFMDYVKSHDKPLTVMLGIDWSEIHRIEAPKRNYEKIEGVTVDYPLLWKPYEFRNYHEVVRSWSIETPRLYNMGFSHNNCGGRCFKQGLGSWRILDYHFPERYDEVMVFEEWSREQGDRRADRSICKNQSKYAESKELTLRELREANDPIEGQPVQEDIFSCMCGW